MRKFFYIERKSNKTIIFLQGGPALESFYKPNFDKTSVDKIWWSYVDMCLSLKDYFKNYNIASTIQSQMYKPLPKIKDLKDARIYLNKTIKNIEETIKHFKKLDHKIIVLGQSYGGYLIQEYLKQKGNDKDIHWVVANSRIKSPIILSQNLIENHQMVFLNNQDEKIGRLKIPQNEVGIKLMLALVEQTNYQKELDHLNLSNLFYLSSQPDKWLGSFSNTEINWANKKGAKVLVTDSSLLEAFKKEVAPKGKNFQTDFKTLAHNTLFYSKIIDMIKKWANN